MAEILASLKKKGGGGAEFILTVTYTEDYYGATITATDGTTTLTATATSSGEVEFTIPNEGSWTVSVVIDGVTISQQVSVVEEYSVAFPIPAPDGATVTPVNDIQTWLKCAGITDKSYTTLPEVINDTATYEALLADSNACEYLVRSIDWIDKELVPAMTSDTTPEGECFASSVHTDAALGSKAWNAFDGNYNTAWHANTQQNFPQSVGYKFTSAVELSAIKIRPLIYNNNSRLNQYKVQASNNNSTWVDVTETLTAANQTSGTPMTQTGCQAGAWIETVFTKNIGAYQYYRLVVNSSYDSNKAAIVDIQFNYGITVNEKAMSYLGKYDCACSKLLMNLLWVNAIINSACSNLVAKDLVPIMTSDTTPSGQVIYSNYNSGSGYSSYAVFDNNTSTNWMSTDTTYGTDKAWVGYDFKRPVLLVRYSTYHTMNRFASWEIEGSNDKTTWTSLDSQNDVSISPPVWLTFDINPNNIAPYRYLRIRCTKSLTGSPASAPLGELQFYGHAMYETLTPLIPAMTSNTTPSGECSGSSIYNSTYDYYYAFNGDNTTHGWCPSGSDSYGNAYVKYEFPSAIVADAFKIRIHVNNEQSKAKVFKLQGSSDNSNWIDLVTTDGILDSDVDHYYLFENIVSYKYYKVIVVSGNGGSIVGNEGIKIQLYQRIIQTNIIHSAANDTVYYLDELNNPTVLCTTDSNGVGYCDLTSLGAGVHTFISSVAKNPDSLENYFSKQILITDTIHGHRTELYLMPDSSKTLYWYGNEEMPLIYYKDTYGGTITKNTNNVTISKYTTTSTNNNLMYSKNLINLNIYTSLNIVIQFSDSTSYYQRLGYASTMNAGTVLQYQITPSAGTQKATCAFSANSGKQYVGYETNCYPTLTTIHALWIE